MEKALSHLASLSSGSLPLRPGTTPERRGEGGELTGLACFSFAH